MGPLEYLSRYRKPICFLMPAGTRTDWTGPSRLFRKAQLSCCKIKSGGMGEWLKPAVLKTQTAYFSK